MIASSLAMLDAFTVIGSSARQGMGYGESIVRRLILSEGYAQSPFYTGRDLRIREITQGYNVTDAIDRGLATTAQYDSVFIQHSVPRFNNPTGTFDNDQYLLEIITQDTTASGAFTDAVDLWLEAAQGTACVQFTEYACPDECVVPTPGG